MGLFDFIFGSNIKKREKNKYIDSLVEDFRPEDSAADALAERRDLRTVEQIIDDLFNRSSMNSEPSFYSLGDYGRLIYDVSGLRSEVYSGEVRPDIMESDLYRKSNEAIQKLCAIDTPISSNILHKVTQMKDFDVQVNIRVSEASRNFGNYEDRSCSGHKDWGFYLQKISFEDLRRSARDELERRGNPSYDPSAYLEESAWKLDKLTL